MVFTDENYVAKKLSRKTRPNPPPDVVNQIVDDGSAEFANDDRNEHNGTPFSAPGSRKTSVFTAPPVDFKKAAEVLKEIEDKVYRGGLPRAGTYHSVFKQLFDCDGDGFVSHADFEGACRKLQIKADPLSIMHAVRALDKEQKGYFDYKEFTKKMGPGMSERVASFENGEELDNSVRLPDVGPNKFILTQ